MTQEFLEAEAALLVARFGATGDTALADAFDRVARALRARGSRPQGLMPMDFAAAMRRVEAEVYDAV
jgi:hypothetical protein